MDKRIIEMGNFYKTKSFCTRYPILFCCNRSDLLLQPLKFNSHNFQGLNQYQTNFCIITILDNLKNKMNIYFQNSIQFPIKRQKYVKERQQIKRENFLQIFIYLTCINLIGFHCNNGIILLIGIILLSLIYRILLKLILFNDCVINIKHRYRPRFHRL